MGDGAYMTDWTDNTAAARTWFETLRNRICAAFEQIERECGSDAAFAYTAWDREEEGNPDPGGGVRGVMKGKVFEKVGVNVSTVRGRFAGSTTARALTGGGAAASFFFSPPAVAGDAKTSSASSATTSPPRYRAGFMTPMLRVGPPRLCRS